MMKVSDIENAAASLANQLDAGIQIREAVHRMAKLQPKFAEFWLEAGAAVARGTRLSEKLSDQWPEELVFAVKAGEESGHIGAVLRQIQSSMEVKQKIKKAFSTLISPAFSFLMGLGVFLFFMVGVIPKLQKSLGGGEKSFIFALSSFLENAVMNYWYLIVIVLGGAILGVTSWLKQRENWEKVLTWANGLPILGEAMRNLNFGMWAYYLALLDSAGLPMKAQLLLSVKTLPEVYQDGVFMMAEEVEKRGRADSADPDKQIEGDPRKDWPYYIASAFINAHETGNLDQEMTRIAPILVNEGTKSIAKFTAIADVVAKLIAAGMIAMPMFAYFAQLSYSLTKAFST